MKRDDDSLNARLDRHMGQAGEPPSGQVAASVEAVWERLKPEAERSTLPAYEMVRRRSPLTLVAAVVVMTAALGLYAARRTGLLDAVLPDQQQAQPQVAFPNSAVSVGSVGKGGANGNVEESKEPAATSEALQPAVNPVAPVLPSVIVDDATTQAQGTDAGVDSKPAQGTTGAAPRVAFEVAVIRRVLPPLPTESTGWTIDTARRLRADAVNVRALIGWAQEVTTPQVKGGPEWLDRELYNIEARAASDATGAQIRAMVRTLFTERFKLSFHRKIEEEVVYFLSVSRNGSKLAYARGGQQNRLSQTGAGRVTFSGFVIPRGLTDVLASYLGASVFDETGLSGAYDFSLEFADPRSASPGQVDARPDLITAVREQLGLELRQTKRWVQVIVIDHIERPSEY
jgi:uncharacterized protein (TIGR03435 family)